MESDTSGVSPSDSHFHPHSPVTFASVPRNRLLGGKACSQCHRQKQRIEQSPVIRRESPPENSAATALRLLSEPVHHQQKPPSRLVSRHLARLFKARGAPSYHGDSHFGHQSAAVMMETSAPEMSGGHDAGLSRRARLGETQAFRSERGPYAHIWELVGSLPRQKATVGPSY
ncbi:hypothetical protein N431DRAFT_557410 [Stipitochalara longipes BDJ]|nr:hypothetical protein N431DRAFT_557410 [Stipitochalara longipes BDJ]